MNRRNLCICSLLIISSFLVSKLYAQSAGTPTDKAHGQNNVQVDAPVRHLIMWTLKGDVTKNRKDSIVAELRDDFRKLKEKIPGILKLDLLYEGRLESSNCDFMFDFLFESEEALKSFSTNPEHLKSAGKLKPYIAGRTCLDISTDISTDTTTDISTR